MVRGGGRPSGSERCPVHTGRGFLGPSALVSLGAITAAVVQCSGNGSAVTVETFRSWVLRDRGCSDGFSLRLPHLQAEGGGGQPDAPLCPDPLWGHSVLDRLADTLHSRL